MRIALVGYGKMGKRIETLASENGDEISHRITTSNMAEISTIQNTDVIIEFTRPDAAIENYKMLAPLGIPIVTGTTGWNKDLTEVEKLVEKYKIPFFYASNFSVGIHITLAINNYLAAMMKRFPDYDARIEEWHHTEKKDAPSGTAITLAEGLIKNHTGYAAYGMTARNAGEKTLPVISHREDEIPGTHEIIYQSDVDEISIKHTALNRDGFALGAMKAADFVRNQKPGIYTMNHLLNTSL